MLSSTLRPLWIFLVGVSISFGVEGKVLFIAGEASHGWNEHEFPKGCEVLAKGIRESGLGLEAEVSIGWPEESAAFEGVRGIVIYCDGGESHVAELKLNELRGHYENGIGVAVLHYALEPRSEELADFLLDSIGGYFDVGWSVNPVWDLKNSILARRLVDRGVASLEIKDEWYYHIRFRDDGAYQAILSGNPDLKTLGDDGPRSGNPDVRKALTEGEAQHLAWIRESSEGKRGFGFTGGHFHHNWNDADFRKLALNGIAWIAGAELPKEGVSSAPPRIPVYKTIDEAIARGHLGDVETHLINDPSLLDKMGRSKMTPLQQAIMRKKADVAELLIGKGADPNIQTGSQQNGLHLAVVRNMPEMCVPLKGAGVALGARDKQGWTALHLAAAKNKPEMVKALLEIGCDPNTLSRAGGTALHEAAASGGAEVVTMILEAGVDTEVVSSHGVTALQIAKQYENGVAVDLLKNR